MISVEFEMYTNSKVIIAGDPDAVNRICSALYEAEGYCKEHGYETLADETYSWAKTLYDALDEQHFFDEVREEAESNVSEV